MTLQAHHEILDMLMTVLDEEHAEAVVEHRKSTIRKPFTVHAAKLLAKEFAKCRDPNAAADEMILRAWQGFKAEWMEKIQPAKSYQRNSEAAHGTIGNMLFGDENGADHDAPEYSRWH